MVQGRIAGHDEISALVADGDADTRALLASLLERLRCEVRQVADGDAALAEAHARPPALVVLNVHLAGTSGYEICRELRESFGDRLPIMFVAEGELDPEEEITGLLLGADQYVSKPIQPGQFLARARRLLANARAAPPGASALPPR